MKLTITILLLFGVQLSAFSQANVTREVTKFWNTEIQDWTNSDEIIYQYNDNKEVTLIQESTWGEAENKFIGEDLTTYDYHDSRTVVSEYRAIYDGKLYWILTDTSEHIYNEEGCEVQFNENSEFVEWRWEYEYFNDCTIKSATRYSKITSTEGEEWFPNERVLYTYSNDFKNKNITAEKYAGFDEWSLLYKGHEYYDDRGNLIEKFNSNDPHELFENSYDNNDRLVHQILYTPDTANILMQRRESQYEYFEDENGFLIKMLLHRRYNSNPDFFTRTFLYENYCDGLVKTLEYISQDGKRIKYFYEYDESTTCLESEELNILISPNPTSGELTISSDLLLQNSTLSIFSSNGQLIQNVSVPQRTDFQQLFLSALPNGTYFIRIKNDQHSITEPFVILK